MNCKFVVEGEMICSIDDRESKCFSCGLLRQNNQMGEFYKSKDQLWNFVDVHVTGKPERFGSKRKWKNFLKRHNKHDDVSAKSMVSAQNSYYNDLDKRNKKETRKVLEEAYMTVKRRRF